MLNAAPPEGLSSAAVPSPCLLVLLIIPFKWNVNPLCPQLQPCRYLFNFHSAPIYSALLPRRLFLFLLILFLSQSSLSSISTFPFQLPAAVIPSLHCSGSRSVADGYRLQLTKEGDFYHAELNKSIWFHKYISTYYLLWLTVGEISLTPTKFHCNYQECFFGVLYMFVCACEMNACNDI